MPETPDKLAQFEQELRAEHEALTAAYTQAHEAAETAWAAYEAQKTALTTFRAKYGRVLKALDAKAVTVTE